MKEQFNIPEEKNINTYINSKPNEYDYSYSAAVKAYIGDALNLSSDELKNIEYVFFKPESRALFFSRTTRSGQFNPEDNLVRLLADERLKDQVKRVAVHETGHAITLSNTAITISEGLAMQYERDYLDARDENFGQKRPHYDFSLDLVDSITNSIFGGDKERFRQMTKRGNDKAFLDLVSKFLKHQNVDISARELFTLCDIAFKIESNCISYLPPDKVPKNYFRDLFPTVKKLVPMIFNSNANTIDGAQVTASLEKYRRLAQVPAALIDSVCQSAGNISPTILIDFIHSFSEGCYSYMFSICEPDETSVNLTYGERIKYKPSTVVPGEKFLQNKAIREFIETCSYRGLDSSEIYKALSCLNTLVDTISIDMECINTKFNVSKKPDSDINLSIDGKQIGKPQTKKQEREDDKSV